MENNILELLNLCKQCERQASLVQITTEKKFIYKGPGGSNGSIGDSISDEDIKLITEIFKEPIDAKKLKKRLYDQAGFCAECKDFYCGICWNSSNSGYGKCPEGHDKSLDPHWSPE